MIRIVLILIASTVVAAAEPLPVPEPPIAGKLSVRLHVVGVVVLPMLGAQTAIGKPTSGGCPWGWTSSGNFCLRSGIIDARSRLKCRRLAILRLITDTEAAA